MSGPWCSRHGAPTARCGRLCTISWASVLDIGRGQLAVVPQVPDGQRRVAGSNIRLGSGSVDVTAKRGASTLTTRVTRRLATNLLIGHVLPDDAEVSSVTLNGAPAEYQVRSTARGRDVVVDAGVGTGTSRLVVTITVD